MWEWKFEFWNTSQNLVKSWFPFKLLKLSKSRTKPFFLLTRHSHRMRRVARYGIRVYVLRRTDLNSKMTGLYIHTGDVMTQLHLYFQKPAKVTFALCFFSHCLPLTPAVNRRSVPVGGPVAGAVRELGGRRAERRVGWRRRVRAHVHLEQHPRRRVGRLLLRRARPQPLRLQDAET